MEERTKTRIKRVMESPYSIDITPLDQDKSSKILKLLFEVINKDKSLANLFLRHDEIKDGLDHNEVRAIILIKTVQYEKFYKHIPIIASLKNVHFVLIEKEYIESNSYYTPINIPYLFNNTNYINTKFKVEKVKGKHYDKNLSRKEKKKIRKSIKKNNI